jgi:hypothetical protein
MMGGEADARTRRHRRKKTSTVSQPPADAASPSAATAETTPDAPKTTTYDPNAGFPERNGALSGMLVVIPKSELAAFGQPGPRHLNRVARAEPGAELALKLVFTGPQADADSVVDVTYDLQVLGPDGKLYGDSDYRGLEALHGKIASGGVFDNRGKVVLLSFDPGDAGGAYTIKATLHDQVAKIDLPLMTTVELLSKAPAKPAGDEAASEPAAAPRKKRRRKRRH